MYEVEKTPWGKVLTESEILNETISSRKLRMILQMKKVTVRSISKSMNNYGEFLFMTLSIGKTGIEFYGAGFHELRNRWLIGDFKMFSNSFDQKKKVDKSEALRTFDTEVGKAWKYMLQENGKSERTAADDFADMCGDDDAFSSELQDNPELAEELGVDV